MLLVLFINPSFDKREAHTNNEHGILHSFWMVYKYTFMNFIICGLSAWLLCTVYVTALDIQVSNM